MVYSLESIQILGHSAGDSVHRRRDRALVIGRSGLHVIKAAVAQVGHDNPQPQNK